MLAMTQVINLRDHEAVARATADGTYVRIDRRTPWGNPFPVRREAQRAESLRHYLDHLRAHPDVVAAARTALAGQTLACWCVPRACHGMVLAALADAPPTVDFLATPTSVLEQVGTVHRYTDRWGGEARVRLQGPWQWAGHRFAPIYLEAVDQALGSPFADLAAETLGGVWICGWPASVLVALAEGGSGDA
jgi:hypothetical protein